jgi:hypothetical protein
LIGLLFIKLFFKTKSDIEKSPYYPISKGLSIISSAYVARFGLSTIVIKVVSTVFNKPDFPSFNILFSANEVTSNTIVDIVFYLSVTSIVIVYSLISFNKRKIVRVFTLPPPQIPKIEFPEDNYSIIPIFYERIKTIVELKYEKDNLILNYDERFKVLYGIFNQGLHSHYMLIYCEDSPYNIKITQINLTKAEDSFQKVLDFLKFRQNSQTILSKKYIVENGTFAKSIVPNDIQLFNEDEYLKYIINFRNYLQRLIKQFDDYKLPFSNDQIKKRTLKSTYVKQDYSIGDQKGTKKTPINSFLDKYLSESSSRHYVILGDYGMGKSTLLKYYASLIAKDILNSNKIVRFPIYISLTNTSPRHGGIENAIGKFVADNLGVSSKLFNELVHRGKILFLLDGFDEMGFIGTHSQRIKQLNAIWKLAFKNNKIIISGRPSYFPRSEELNIAFNIKNYDSEIPNEQPYYEKINLKPFNKEQILESLSKYYSGKDFKKYSSFILNNKSILELCKRPSLMHIVREMLPRIFSDAHTTGLAAGSLIESYLKHWIERQYLKKISGSIDDNQQKERYIFSFFQRLAGEYYKRRSYKLPCDEIINILNEDIASLNLQSKEEREGFESEILTGYFIEIESDEYRFVHKSFLEYFVSKEILKLIKAKKYKDPLISQCDWSEEIINFIYESDEFSNHNNLNKSKVPLLLIIASRNRALASLKAWIFKLRAFIYWALRNSPNLKFMPNIANLFIKVNVESMELIKKNYDYLLNDEYIKVHIPNQNISDEIVELRKIFETKELTFSKVIRFIDIIEPRIGFGMENSLSETLSNNIGIAAKAYYIAILKGQLELKNEHPIVFYLRKKLKKRFFFD